MIILLRTGKPMVRGYSKLSGSLYHVHGTPENVFLYHCAHISKRLSISLCAYLMSE